MANDKILAALKNLNTNKDSTTWDQRTKQLAPHKPFLLLSILDGIEGGWITEPRISLSQDLIETFFRYWKQIMGKDRSTTIALPFYHMNSEPFWNLQYKEGMSPYKNSPSLGGLMNRVSHAGIDDQLYSMMRDVEGMQLISEIILATYFSDEVREAIRNIQRINVGAYRYAEQLELLAAEPFKKYHQNNNEIYSSQRIQLRQYGFGLKIRTNFNHRCAICRSKVKTPNGQSLVEGAHIIPWSKSKNDDPRNGMALCKTHHWMFDTHLLTVKPDYRIKLSMWLKNNGEQIENTLSWEREKIRLPQDKCYYPSILALEEHYQEFKEAN